jgi:ElaB/YqjD/DUF883 family membrane-anchored ribosome-binding protein
MHKLKHKAIRSEDFDLYDDLAKIKAALVDTSRDIKGKAGAILSESLAEAKERTAAVHDDVSERITERPLLSISLAALAGLVIGYVMRK